MPVSLRHSQLPGILFGTGVDSCRPRKDQSHGGLAQTDHPVQAATISGVCYLLPAVHP